MKLLNLKITLLSIFGYLISLQFCHAQQGHITINQDSRLPELLNLKKEMTEDDTDRYKIQIYSGNSRNSAYGAETNFKSAFPYTKTIVVYEEPNFKTWVGNYRTKIEADRDFKKIKEKFSSALIFKPKKNTAQ